jgi:hypothetical protein
MQDDNGPIDMCSLGNTDTNPGLIPGLNTKLISNTVTALTPAWTAENTAVGIPYAGHVALTKVVTDFAGKRRSLGWYSSLVDSIQRSLVLLHILLLREHVTSLL